MFLRLSYWPSRCRSIGYSFAVGFIWRFLWLLLSTALVALPVAAESTESNLVGEKNHLEPELSPSYSYWQQGELELAIAIWQKAAAIYRAQKQPKSEIETRLKIAQGYISLGRYRSAIAQLKRVRALTPGDSRSIAITEKRFGNAYSGLGEYERAISSYQKSLESENSLSTLNNLVKVLLERASSSLLKAQAARQNRDATQYRSSAQRDRALALEYAKRALALSLTETSSSSVRALIEWHQLSHQQLSPLQLDRGQTILENLLPSRSTAFLMLNWAEIDHSERERWLHKAKKVAATIGDLHALSYAELKLGYFYAAGGDLERALVMAQKAQFKAQSKLAYDSLFRAQQLAGRIYQQLGQEAAAIDAYRGAIASIDIIAQNLMSTEARQIADFNREIEPVYRETLKLLLNNSQDLPANLTEALVVFDKLRLAQLQSYFGDNCFEIIEQNLSSKNVLQKKNAALINSIILEDRVVFILQLPDGRLVQSEAAIIEAELIELATQWHRDLKTRFTWQFRTGSRLFYDLIVRPFEAELASVNPQVLVFIHDGILRNLPMAALSDGEKFLAQKWASVSSIGLNFTSTSMAKQDLAAVAFGLETTMPGWSQLDNVAAEINSVREIIGGDKFLNQEFTIDNLSRQLRQEDYSVVHLATHGYFGGDAETSFIMAYNQKISALKLETILTQSRQVIDLLVLSACETAVGSDRALLGLAGVAARSGVASTLGSLWQVQDDEQSEIIEAFYSHLSDDTSNKAIALQKVQIEQIRLLAHPQKWAALNLIGDW